MRAILEDRIFSRGRFLDWMRSAPKLSQILIDFYFGGCTISLHCSCVSYPHCRSSSHADIKRASLSKTERKTSTRVWNLKKPTRSISKYFKNYERTNVWLCKKHRHVLFQSDKKNVLIPNKQIKWIIHYISLLHCLQWLSRYTVLNWQQTVWVVK